MPEDVALNFDAVSDVDEAPKSSPDGGQGTPYRVLARKYRPRIFSDLIGQDVMVRTLRNSFSLDRIAQAWMLTGVRGIGKTTTARLIARALNYAGVDGVSGPTLDMDALGTHCAAILESRHMDVIEMDAASNSSVESIRDLIDGVRYAPASARYKVYIIDEIHMLSRSAFNALLKTLEEPPSHVKFIFATTEIRKVPVTILSRCQRFDLRRIGTDMLIDHLRSIASIEGVSIDADALLMIGRSAEGSVRDGLSLLDQAIAYGGGVVDGDLVRSMLGLSDRVRVVDLFEKIMGGEIAAGLVIYDDACMGGVEASRILSDLADFTYFVTRLQVMGGSDGAGVGIRGDRSEDEVLRGRALSGSLSMPHLCRAWQLLLRGIEEVSGASDSHQAGAMVLIRMGYVADLPTPEDLTLLRRDVSGLGGVSASRVEEVGVSEVPDAVRQYFPDASVIDVRVIGEKDD